MILICLNSCSFLAFCLAPFFFAYETCTLLLSVVVTCVRVRFHTPVFRMSFVATTQNFVINIVEVKDVLDHGHHSIFLLAEVLNKSYSLTSCTCRKCQSLV